MTRDQIASKIRHNLNDAGVTYYSVADVNDSIQDGYDEVVVYCECIEKSAIVDFKSDTTYYNLSTLIPDYYRPIRIYSYNINRFMELNLELENSGYSLDWELTNGSARDYIIKGPKYIGISNRISNATGSFKIWYKAQANVLTGNDIPRINVKFQLLLENYGTADLLEQNQEYTKAQIYWSQYNKQLEDYRYKIQLLSKTDRIFAREPNQNSIYSY